MTRIGRSARLVVVAVVLAAGAVAAGCGSEASSARDRAAQTVTAPSSDSASGSAPISHPSGADDVVVRIAVGDGHTTADYALRRQPDLLVTGDGRVFLPAGGADPVSSTRVVQAGESSVQTLLDLARRDGLLDRPPAYPDDVGVVDLATTTVTIAADGHTRVHAAYALGGPTGDDAESGARGRLASFVRAAQAMYADADATTYDAEQVRLLAVLTTTRAGRAQPWTDADVTLAEAGSCVVVPAAGVEAAMADTTPTTVFTQDGRGYSVAAAQVLPGDPDSC